MTFINTRRVVAAIVAASCIAVPASASAYSLPSTYRTDAAQSGTAFSLPSTYRTDAAQSGGATTAAPTTIEVVRPERTIVRDADEALPLILSGSALLLVFAGLGFMLIRTGSVPRLGRSH